MKSTQDKLTANRRSESLLAAAAAAAQDNLPANKNGLQSIASSPAFSTLIQQQQQQQQKNDEIKYEPGIIKYDVNGETKQITYFSYNIHQQNSQKNSNKTVLHYLDKVCAAIRIKYSFNQLNIYVLD
jgi:hypothetical protein